MFFVASRFPARRILTGTRSWSSLPDGYMIRQARITRKFRPSRFLVGTSFSLVGLYHASKLASEVGSDEVPDDYVYSEHWEQKHLELKGQEEKTDKNKNEESSNIFIPMTWASKRHVEPYDEDSPEWQSFVQLEGDSGRRERLCKDIEIISCKAALNSADIRRKLGNGQVQVLGSIRVIYPPRPPQEYECSGLALDGNGSVTWKTGVVNLHRVRRFAVPYAAAKALWAGSSFVARTYYNKIARLLGVNVKDSPPVKHLQQPNSFSDSHSLALQDAPGWRPLRSPIIAHAALILKTTFRRAIYVPPRPVRGYCRFRGIVIMRGQVGGCVLLVNSDYVPLMDAWVKHRIDLFDDWPDPRRPTVQKMRSDESTIVPSQPEVKESQAAPKRESSPPEALPQDQSSNTEKPSSKSQDDNQSKEATEKPSNGPSEGPTAGDG